VRRTPEALRDGLAALDAAQLRRRAQVPGAGAIDFSSNDYLGLARHPALAKAMAAAAASYGAGSGAAHLVTGHGPEHAALEEELADFVGRERALLFATGYMANLGVVGALVGRGDLVLSDALNHASLIDACALSRAEVRRFAHLDHASADSLSASWRAEHPSSAAAIITDAVFSMDGDLAPLPELAACARRHDAWLLADDAHGLGVLGAHGRGSCEHFNLDSEAVPVLVGTLGKAFGSFGAFVAGERDLVDWILQKARTYIYTTAPPQPVAAATRAALRLAESESWRRERLLAHIADFRARCARAGVPLTGSGTPIQPLLLGDSGRALRVSDWLLQRGLIVRAIRPPTVPAGTARLRIALSARHADRDIAQLAEALAEALRLFP
jgi:8-amino-7-oxononanoate synthase